MKSDQAFKRQFQQLRQLVEHHHSLPVQGYLTRVVGMKLEASGCHAPIGTRCVIINDYGKKIEAEIVGFERDTTFLMCLGKPEGLAPGAVVKSTGSVANVPVGEQLLGRVINGLGQPLDEQGRLGTELYYPLVTDIINPLHRQPINQPLDVGVRAINSLLTVGRGQRLGLFAGSGVGKSVLLSMMTRFTEAEVIVVGLIGERGREVKEFIEQNLGDEGLKRSVIVAAPADTSPLMRIHSAYAASSIAEYFRDQGKHVLLLMDSLSRFAQAQRELGLSIGEPPATKGYPPSVFSHLAKLVERAGNGATNCGSITAFYTVLAEGDDQNDPIADSARSFLDGHFVLSRRIAESGLYPAIDIEASISRVLPQITTPEHQAQILAFRQYYSKYQQNADLINLGAYTSGSDPEIDKAIKLQPVMRSFLSQDMRSAANFNDSVTALNNLLETPNSMVARNATSS